jgi:hypothetical protein
MNAQTRDYPQTSNPKAQINIQLREIECKAQYTILSLNQSIYEPERNRKPNSFSSNKDSLY